MGDRLKTIGLYALAAVGIPLAGLLALGMAANFVAYLIALAGALPAYAMMAVVLTGGGVLLLLPLVFRRRR